MPDEVFAYPVSYAQQRLWFLDQIEPGTPFYNISYSLRLSGSLNVAALEQGINEVVNRHESLRTAFAMIDGEPAQIISKCSNVPLPVIDLRGLAPPDAKKEVDSVAAEEANRPFDLSRSPLLRALLLRLGEEDHCLLLSMHHIISDGWSIEVFNHEMFALLEVNSAGSETYLPDLPIQYIDYTIWQREWLQGEVLEAQLAYWRRQLAGAPAMLDLPSDRARPPVNSFRGASRGFNLPKPLSYKINALSQREEVTLFMMLLASFKVLLHRLSGQDRIVIGSPIANRTQVEVEQLIGFFVNTLVLHTDVSGDPSFRELLKRVKEVALGAYAHQDLPFEKLVEDLRPDRSTSYSPLFQVMFQLINLPVLNNQGDPESGEENFERDEPYIEKGTAKFDVGMDMWESPSGLAGGIEYSTDLFDDITIERILKHFETLLEGITSDPDQRISQLSLLTEAEANQLLKDWNNTIRDYPEEKCVHELFELQASRTPEAIALVCNDEEISYTDLNARANKLARYLRRAGVGPEVLVGIYVNRSIEMIVGLFAILKAGGAYVPLDPDYPKQRIALMLEDSRAQVLVTEEGLLEEISERHSKVICVDRDSESIERESGENLDGGASPANLAYVIYTSGSTGKPKGVMITHKSLVNWTEMAKLHYGLAATDSILQFSTISFDTAVEEIFPCLTLGARLVVRPESTPQSAGDFLRQCREVGITVLIFPTAYWHEIVREVTSGFADLPEAIRLVIFGGERALPELLEQWHENVRQAVRLMHGYGPTEITVVAIIADLSAREIAEAAMREVPIGKPIGNAQAFLLDKQLQPVPQGVCGELYIGGAGLARGYFAAPEITAEKFIPNPFSLEPGARLYKTGDLVRYRQDGQIEFLGRVDNQLKIRGFRIELREIEAALNAHPAVRESVVMAREDAGGDRRLIAYLSAESSPESSTGKIRRFLKDLLPEYMIPSSFVFLDTFPLTPNGKIDRAALPDPQGPGRDCEAPLIAPRNEIERSITDVWKAILGAEEIGVYDNFFDLGGHSLSMVRAHRRLQEVLKKEFSILDLFMHPTVASLAERVSGQEPEPASFESFEDLAGQQREALARRRQTLEWRARTGD